VEYSARITPTFQEDCRVVRLRTVLFTDTQAGTGRVRLTVAGRHRRRRISLRVPARSLLEICQIRFLLGCEGVVRNTEGRQFESGDGGVNLGRNGNDRGGKRSWSGVTGLG
jgi:hypothetical protein